MTLTELRTSVVDELASKGYRAYAHLPARVTPPFFVVAPDAPYITETDSYVNSQVNLVVTYVVKQGTNEKTVADIEAAIETTIQIMKEAHWSYVVDEPSAIRAGETTLPGVQIHVSTDLKI